MVRKHIVFISWKDIKHPKVGGAEVVQQEISERFVKDGCEVTHLVPGYKDCSKEDEVNGVKIVRIGKSVLSFYSLPLYFLRNLEKNTDILVDAFNCFGSFTLLFSKVKTKLFLIYHIQDKIWFYQTAFPFIFPLNYVGYVVEKFQLLLLGLFFKGNAVTISDSTKDELSHYGFKKERIQVLNLGTDVALLPEFTTENKNKDFSIFFVGRLEKMKRPFDVVKVYEILKDSIPNLKVEIAGKGPLYGKLENYIRENSLNGISLLGFVSHEEKVNLMTRSHIMLSPAVKEGWGLTVIESARRGTTSIVYDVSGLRDSCVDGVTGYRVPFGDVELMAKKVLDLYNNKVLLRELSLNGYNRGKSFDFDQTYNQFKLVLP